MLDLNDDASRLEKCYTTIARLPAFVDPKQPSTKRSPFSAILSHPFVHTVEVIIPEDEYSSMRNALESKLQQIRYGKVFMSLSNLLEGDFFNTYIKSGNVLMISEGRSGSDNIYTLNDGILKLELGREVYERTGLTGKPIRSGGRKHAKERFLVELNLRLPSMLHGKKGFERIVWAFKNVLNHSVTWLFCDLAPESDGVSKDDPTLKSNHPHIFPITPSQTTHRDTLIPPLHDLPTPSSSPPHQNQDTDPESLESTYNDLSEWLSLISLGSPRVSKRDSIDPYLCRYSVPGYEHEENANQKAKQRTANLVSLKWHGLVPPRWIVNLFVALLQGLATGESTSTSSGWFALSASALGREAVEAKDGYTVMVLPEQSSSGDDKNESEKGKNDQYRSPRDGRQFVCWEYVGASVLEN